MTKTQAKKQMREILERLGAIQIELSDLAYEAQDTAEEIEPYEGKNDLTIDQEERQAFFENLADSIQTAADSICETIYDLEEAAEV